MKISGRIVKVAAFQVLFIVGPKKVWLPRLEIRNLAAIRQRPENQNFPAGVPVNVPVTLSIPRWLAERKFGARVRGAQAGTPAPPGTPVPTGTPAPLLEEGE